MRSNLITVLACLGLVSAMPAKREPMDEHAVRAVLKELEVRGETVDQLIKRVPAKVYRDAIPDCNDSANDPSYMIPKQTGYSVDQGIKLPKSGNDDACTTGHNSDHCWTEYYFVESAVEYSSWQNSGAAIDCRTTSSCNSDSSIASQSCTAHTKSWSNGMDWQIVEAKLEMVIPDTTNKVSIGSNVKYQHSDAQADTTTICTTDSTTNRCTWNDQGCHQVWYADRTKRIWGHMSRVCVGKTDGEVQQQTQNKNGRWVRGQAEFSIALPVNRIVGCNAKCEDLVYNEPLPNEGIQRTPFDVTFD
ncbi:Ff.00g043050.m01.CDS01 [Fusarium sp. VM40]|nr:Ff.00g043050.m01.CDS01 [Fusarium sp. VM40]